MQIKITIDKTNTTNKRFFRTRFRSFFKRNIDQKWRSPGIVIGQDGATVFIRQGGLLYKVHCSRTQKICDSNLPSAIDLQSTENNMSSSIKKQ